MPQNRNRPTLTEALDVLDGEVKQLRDMTTHGGSRYVGPGADPAVVDHIAGGGTIKRGTAEHVDARGSFTTKSARTAEPGQHRGRSGGSLAKAVLAVARHQTEHLTPVWADKALAESTDVAGGFLLEPEIADSVMMLIRARAATLKLPVTTVNPRSKRFDLPGLATGASAGWLTENAALPVSAQSFQIAAQMVPRPLGGLVSISNRLLADATSDNPWTAGSVEDVIKTDVADLLAVTLDSGLINGGTNAPTGLLNTTGSTPLAGFTIPTNGYSITSGSNTYQLLVSIVNTLRQASMPFRNPGWLLSPRTLAGLESLTNSLGEPLLKSSGDLTIDAGDGTSGTLMGFRFYTTANIPTTMTYGTATNASAVVFAGDWDEAYFGNWQAFAIDSSSEASFTPDGGTTWISAYQSMQTLFRATIWADFTVRRPAAFCIVKGILP